MIDTLICVLFPIVEMVFGACARLWFVDLRSFYAAYIVQGHRFDIFEQVGCYPHVVNMLPSYFLVAMWPLLIGLISAIYCGVSPPLLSLRVRIHFPNFRAHVTLIPTKTSTIFPVHVLKLFLDHESILSPHGSRWRRIVVHHPSRNLSNCPQLNSRATGALGQLARYPL